MLRRIHAKKKQKKRNGAIALLSCLLYTSTASQMSKAIDIVSNYLFMLVVVRCLFKIIPNTSLKMLLTFCSQNPKRMLKVLF